MGLIKSLIFMLLIALVSCQQQVAEDPTVNGNTNNQQNSNIANAIPTVTLVSPLNVVIGLGSTYNEPGYFAYDQEDGDLTSKVQISGYYNKNEVGLYTLAYTVIDKNSQISNVQYRYINVISNLDYTPPTISLVGSSALMLSIGQTYYDPGFIATDNVDGNLTNSVLVTNNINNAVPGTYYVTYQVSDQAGNSRTVTRTIIVFEPADTTPPVLTLNGASTINLYINDSFVDPGATALDDKDGDISGLITTNSTVDTGNVGTYFVNYTVSDLSGNIDQKTRIVIVTVAPDSTPPIITLLGSNIILEVEDAYVEPGYTASDNKDGNITSNVSVSSNVNTFIPGSYTITYSVSDTAANSTFATRTVDVIQTETDCTLVGSGGTCDVITSPIATDVDLQDYTINPGDVVCVSPGIYDFMKIEGINGTAQDPISVTNCKDGSGNKVSIISTGAVGISIKGSSFVNIKGNGDAAHPYGFSQTASDSHGVEISDGSTNIEFSHIEVYGNDVGGMKVGTTASWPTCKAEYTRSNFVQDSIKIHNNYIHDNTVGEGILIGGTNYKEINSPLSFGCPTIGPPPALDDIYYPEPNFNNLKIYRNVIDGSGKEGLQIGGAVSGLSVYENTIKNYALDQDQLNSAGLLLDQGTVGEIYENHIEAGGYAQLSDAIKSNGAGFGNINIHDNTLLFVKNGLAFDPQMAGAGFGISYTKNTFLGYEVDSTPFYFKCHPSINTNFTITGNLFTNYGYSGVFSQTPAPQKPNQFNNAAARHSKINRQNYLSSYLESITNLFNNFYQKDDSTILFNSDYSVQSGSPGFGYGRTP